MRFFYLLLFVSLLSCSDEPSVPEGVLPPRRMEAVLYDLVRADELIDVYAISDSLYRKTNRRYGLYDTLFRIHSLSKETFQTSMQYYQSNPQLLKEIIENIQQHMNDTTTKKPLKLN